MSDITMVGLDLAKNVFQLHGVDAQGHQRLARQVKRAQLMSTVAQLPPCTIAMEACAGAHHWARGMTTKPIGCVAGPPCMRAATSACVEYGAPEQ